MRVVFLFNHDAAHQVAHLAGIAAAMTRTHPEVETVIAYAGPMIRTRIEGLIDEKAAGAIRWHELTLGPIARAAAGFLDKVLPASRLGTLTPREREVFQLLAIGKSNKEVATALDMSLGTAKKHRENLQRKLDCHSAAELARLAIREGLLQE